MNYSEVKSLLDAGFTADEIRTMLNNPQNPQNNSQDPEPTPAQTPTPAPDPEPNPAPAPDPEPAPADDERFNQLNETMNRILKAIQASNRNTATVNTVQPDLDTAVDKIMNGIIRPEKEEH